MKRLLFYIALLLACLIVAFTQQGSTLGDLASGGVVGLLLPVADGVASNATEIRHRWYSFRYAKSEIRISASYLFRIKVDGRYLLIQGHRFPQFQPVGGVYKITRSGRAFLSGIGAQDDDLIPFDSTSKDDMRIRIKGKELSRFYSWFESRKGREDSPWREFYEELVENGPLPHSVFPYIFHDYVRRDIDPIRFSEHANCLEILVADIYELLPTEDQLSALQSLIATHPDSIQWVTEDMIRRRGAIPGAPQRFDIARHAQRLIH
ncbi:MULTISPECIES: hypothetical protein [unclassified Streptomyces]|uniref:SMODS-associated NUDIX domain-containing protein n=1 Tax=unclassified Streptomyces TaxID=2593676 RepID=UPI002366C956|nr:MULTISPECIES: hypothetical protein [unclassified Streptomyces]MDF3140343.1 hypothetical protein [Streptomyces sp. T21Q-yed]WDF39386.1 hypothetical protein PBV52_22550 [Streptomyces sp. T12]